MGCHEYVDDTQLHYSFFLLFKEASRITRSNYLHFHFLLGWGEEKAKKKKGSFKSTVAIVWTEYNHGSTDNPPQSEMSEVVLQRWSVVT